MDNRPLPGDIASPDLPVNHLPKYRSWLEANPRSGFSPFSYIRGEVPSEDAAVLVKLFWPDFVLHDGSVFLSVMFREDSYKEWKKQPDRTRQEYEGMVNHLHLDDAFNEDDCPPHEVVVFLGQKLREMWSCKLGSEFGDRRFNVAFDADQEQKEYVISFWEERG